MNPPDSLPAKMFLLAFHPRRPRLTGRGDLGYLLRAAALAEMVLNGQLRDDGGKAVTTGRAPSSDPVSAGLWHEIEADSPRSWRRLIARDRKQTFRAVRDQLAHARVIKLEAVRFLGVFPYTRTTLRDTRHARQIAEQVGRAIRGGQAADRVDRDAALLAALASAGQLKVVLGARDRRRFKARLDQFAAPAEPVVKALHRAIAAKRAAAASGG
jgi:hypothetical protein